MVCKLRQLLVASIIFYLISDAKPPQLQWANNSCWSNTALQLLYNIRPLTEDLLKKETREQYKNNELVTAYINFVDAARNDPENADAAAKKVHGTTCKIFFGSEKPSADAYSLL